jgi:hypothetical protein
MKVQIADSAALHLEEAYHFYEDQEYGSGKYFWDCVQKDIDKLAVTGGVHSKSRSSYYKVNCSHHPFIIYYSLQGEVVTVKAVLDGRRNPVWIKRILSRIKR